MLPTGLPCWRDRGGSQFGSCSFFCYMSRLVLSLGHPTTGAHKVRTGVSIPHPRANSPCHHLTVGWPPTWHPAGTVTRDSRGILPHRDSLEQVACGYWHSVDPLHLVRPWGYSVGRKLPSCWLQVHMGYLLLTTPRERAGCGLRGCW